MYKDKEQMMDDKILSEFLDNAVQQAKTRIAEDGCLRTEDAVPLMLKSQFNHIAHLERDMVTRADFNGLKDQFSGLKDQFSFLKWVILFGFTFLAALQMYIAFVK